MPFFEKAEGFKIEGATFVDRGEDQNNYNYDQSLKVSGHGNSATYNNGPLYHGDRTEINNAGGHMSGVAIGTNAQASYDSNSMGLNQSESQENHASQLHQSRACQQEAASAPPSVNVPFIQITQSTPQRNEPHTSATPSHQSAPPQLENRTTAPREAFIGATVAPSNPHASRSTGSISGTTLAQSPQLAHTTSPPALPSPPPSTTPDIDASTSPGQMPSSVPVLPEFPELKLRRGATLNNAGQEEGKVKKKKKWNFFLRMFRRVQKKAQKKTSVAATA